MRFDRPGIVRQMPGLRWPSPANALLPELLFKVCPDCHYLNFLRMPLGPTVAACKLTWPTFQSIGMCTTSHPHHSLARPWWPTKSQNPFKAGACPDFSSNNCLVSLMVFWRFIVSWTCMYTKALYLRSWPQGIQLPCRDRNHPYIYVLSKNYNLFNEGIYLRGMKLSWFI